eukprot:tig00000475_g1235.t1
MCVLAFASDIHVIKLAAGPVGMTAMGLGLAVDTTWVVRLQMFTGANALPVDGSWHLVTVVVTDSLVTTYLDGQPMPHSKTGTSLSNRAAPIPTVTRPFHRLGSAWDTRDTRVMFVSDFGVWSEALTAVQVQLLYRDDPQPRALSSLELLLPFAGCGTTATDTSGRERHASLVGDVVILTDCVPPAGNASRTRIETGRTATGVYFGMAGTTNDYLQSAAFELGTPFTFSFWILLQKSQNMWARIADFGSGAPLDNFVLAFCPNGFGYDDVAIGASPTCSVDAGKVGLVLVLYTGAGSPTAMIRLFQGSDGIPVDGRWHHVAITLADDAILTYLNGTLRPHSKTGTNLAAAAAPWPKKQRAKHWIARGMWGDTGAVAAALYDWRIYSAVLTQAEVLDVLAGNVSVAAPLEQRLAFDGCGPVTAAGLGGAGGMLPRVVRDAHYIARGRQGEPGLADGYLAEFRVYSGALSMEEVLEEFQRGKASASATLELRYVFDGCDRNVTDRSGNGRNGTIVGDASQIGGQCPLKLPSTSLVFGTKVLPGRTVDQTERFLFAPAFELGTPMTFAFWLRINMSQTNPSALSRVFDFGNGAGSENIPYRKAGYETLLLVVYDGTQLKQRVPLFLANDSIPSDNSWHHVALVLTPDAYYAYLDGVLRPNARASGLAPGSGTVPKRTRTRHYVGAGWWAGPFAYGVELADFRVYSAALSAAQVADVAQGIVPRDMPSLELHYKFDTCGGSAVDYSGKGRPGTMYGDLALSLKCTVPSAGAYFGTSDIGSSPALKHRYIEAPQFAIFSPVTIDLWIKFPPQAPVVMWRRIIDFGCNRDCNNLIVGFCPPGGSSAASGPTNKCNDKASTTGLALFIHIVTNSIQYETIAFKDDNSIPRDGRFHHIAFVFTGTELRTYRNGSFVPHLKTGQGGVSVANLNRPNMYIARSHWGPESPTDVYFSGFRIHSAALTDGQVMEAYLGLQPAAPVALHYKLDSCGSTLEGAFSGLDVPDSSGWGRSGRFFGDIAMACPPPATGVYFGNSGGADALSASQVRLAYASASAPLSGPAPLIAEYLFSDCAANRMVLTSSGEGPAAKIVGDDVSIPCPILKSDSPPAPLVLSAISTGPTTVIITANFTAGVGITTLDAACDAPGALTGAYVGSASVSDADAAGAAVSVTVELAYGGSYVVSCSVKAQSKAGGESLPSAAVNVTVPPGNSIAAQNALMPSGNTGASNAFSRVGNAVDSEESVQIVFATQLANYLVGQRPASHRLGFITRTAEEFTYCDFDLDSNRCSFVQKLANLLGDAEPTDFAYSSMTPWPAKDCDARFVPSNLTAFQSNWPWTSQAYLNASDLVGSTVAAVLRPPSDCAGFGCYSYAAQRWASYAFGGCAPAPYGFIRSWPAGLCTGAGPYDFMRAAAAWTHDFRHFYAAYERTFYEAVSGLSSASPTEEYNWAGMLGNLDLFSISPTGSNANITEHRSRHFRLQPELFGFAWATPGAETSTNVAFGSHFFYGATNCLDFYDAEPSSRTFEGNETASDVRRAYPDLASFDALLLQELRYFQFWQRGVAFFSSFAVLRNSGGPSVVPLLKVCSLPLGVALLKFELASIAPAGFTASAEVVYKSVPWPQENGAFFADSFPVGASVQAMHTDGRVADGGPILYHAIVRIPFFPNASVAGACPVPLVSSICGTRTVAHVIAMFTWQVDPSRFVNSPVGVRSFDPYFPAPSTYRTAVFTHTAPRVLRSEQLALADHWIVQNERPLHAGYGHGYLEGRWVDPPNSKYSFWVTGDRVTRVRKANAFQSGMAGSAADIDGSVQIYKTTDWRGTRREWTSVAAAVYKDGNLYVVQEVHTQANTRVFTLASDGETRPRYVHSRRMKRAAERAPGSRLIRLENVDASAPFTSATVTVTVIVPNFPANILYATAIDDYSSGRMFETDPGIPFAELPWVRLHAR